MKWPAALATDQLAIYRCVSGGGSWTQVGTNYTRPAPTGPAPGYSSVEAADVPFASAGATYVVAQGTPDLAVLKTNNVSGATTVGSAWTWTLHVANVGTSNAVFGIGQTIVLDNLPNSGISYGSASVANIGSGVIGGASISCSIANNDLTCTANPGAVTLGTSNGSFDVVFTATPTSAVTFTNPRGGGSCSVDPNNNNAESNEGNNGCSNSVAVTKADTTTTITSDDPDPSAAGQAVSVEFTVVPTGSGTPTGNVQVSDGVDNCTGTVASGSCNISLTTGGARTLTAHYVGDASFNESTSAGEAHTVAALPPDTTINSEPSNPSVSGSASFSFSGIDRGTGVAGFECNLDDGGFSACTSPKGYSGLSDGSHTFQVRAIGDDANADPTPDSFTWTIDTAAPDTTIDGNPSDPTNSVSASFSFSGTDAGTGVASFECKLDGGGFSACTSSKDYSGLSEGSHTFQVRAIDGLGNPDPTPDSFTWTIDTTAPDTTIGSNPPDPSGSSSASFSFNSTDADASFECQLDGGGFSACTSPKDYSGLSDGGHSFQVRAIDDAGNADPTPDSFAWTIDNTEPDTAIGSKPSNPSGSSSASFSFSGIDGGSGVAGFECKLDAGGFSDCTSPKSYSGLSEGSHTFQVRAIGGEENADPSPASFTWTIDTVPPAVTIDQASGQADPSSDSSIHFGVVFTEPVTGFASGDVTLSGTAGATTALVTGSGTTYDVAVSGMTSQGTVIASIPAGAAVDAVGNGNTASTSGDNTVTYNLNSAPPPNSAPTATVTDGRCSSAGRASGTLNLTLVDADGDTVSLALASSSNTALVPNGNVALGGSGSDRTISVTGAAKKRGTAILTLELSDGTVTVPVTITLKVGSGKANVLNGTPGTDMIFGLAGGDTVRGLGANDLLCGGKGGDTLSGGDGRDMLDGSSGNDSLGGGEGNDILRGSGGNDILGGSGGDDSLTGGNGNDILRGSGGNDSLSGGKGNDNLRGSGGNDSLTGGAGGDNFSGGAGTDVAVDFSAARGDTRDGTIP